MSEEKVMVIKKVMTHSLPELSEPMRSLILFLSTHMSGDRI